MVKVQSTIINTDVLVIGGGSAASRATLESTKAGAKTTLVTKGAYGFSGTSCFHVAEAAGFSASGYDEPTDSPDQHLVDIMEAALGTCSEELAKIVAYEAPRQVPFLESLGLEFGRYKGGYLVTRGCFASKRRSIKLKGHGVPIVGVLKNEILRRGDVQIIEHCMATELIVEENTCRGAFIHLNNGSICEIRAKSTILGTGGAGQLFSESLNPPDVTGDGYAMGYRAGAELVNMEFMQAGFGIAEPAKTIFSLWLWNLSPRIFDEDGIEFLAEYIPEGLTLNDCISAKNGLNGNGHYPFSSRDSSKYLEIAVKKRSNSGKAVYADLRHIKDITTDELEKINPNAARMWPITKAWMIKKGADIDNEPVRIVCYAHAFNGGLLIDRNAETTIKHLYAVGEVSGGYHGADRLGGNMFSSGQVFGEIAGKNAAQNALVMNNDTSAPREEKSNTFTGEKGIESVVRIREKLQRLSTDELLIIRNRQGLQHYLKEIKCLTDELKKCSANTFEEEIYIKETENLMITGYLMVSSALERNESRGSHYREDYSELDDSLREVIIHKIENSIPIMKRIVL